MLDMNPHVLYEYLKEYIIGQDEYCKELAILGYKHQLLCNHDIDLKLRSNLFVIGESGVGKSYGVEILAKLLNCDFIKIDCSSLTTVGYKGNDLGKVLVNSVVKHHNPIVFFDEIDKCIDAYKKDERAGIQVFEEFLKILEDEKYQYGDTIALLDNVTMIFAGSFSNLRNRKIEEIRNNENYSMNNNIFLSSRSIKKSLEINFESNENTKIEKNVHTQNKNNILISMKDLIYKEHIPPEFLGRMDRIIHLNTLTKDDYLKIIKDTQGSLYERIKHYFEFRGILLKITENVFQSIIDKVMLNKELGARVVNNELKRIFNSCLVYTKEIPDVKGIVATEYDNEFDKYIYKIYKKNTFENTKQIQNIDDQNSENTKEFEEITNPQTIINLEDWDSLRLYDELDNGNAIHELDRFVDYYLKKYIFNVEDFNSKNSRKNINESSNKKFEYENHLILLDYYLKLFYELYEMKRELPNVINLYKYIKGGIFKTFIYLDEKNIIYEDEDIIKAIQIKDYLKKQGFGVLSSTTEELLRQIRKYCKNELYINVEDYFRW